MKILPRKTPLLLIFSKQNHHLQIILPAIGTQRPLTTTNEFNPSKIKIQLNQSNNPKPPITRSRIMQRQSQNNHGNH
jgi:hypothetical protein